MLTTTTPETRRLPVRYAISDDLTLYDGRAPMGLRRVVIADWRETEIVVYAETWDDMTPEDIYTGTGSRRVMFSHVNGIVAEALEGWLRERDWVTDTPAAYDDAGPYDDVGPFAYDAHTLPCRVRASDAWEHVTMHTVHDDLLNQVVVAGGPAAFAASSGEWEWPEGWLVDHDGLAAVIERWHRTAVAAVPGLAALVGGAS